MFTLSLPPDKLISMISCIIPAAGLSRRMGRSKPLLTFRGRYFIEYAAAAAAAAARRIIIVTGYRADELERVCTGAGWTGVTLTENPRYELGMFSSIRVGAAALEEGPFFILHADMPLLSPAHTAAAAEAFMRMRNTHAADILQPVCRGIPGHPVFFSAGMRRVILECADTDSMRTVFSIGRVLAFPTEDPAYITDIDTEQEYRDLLSGQ
jgi:molybdenum cofactor cytidylyltransferase